MKLQKSHSPKHLSHMVLSLKLELLLGRMENQEAMGLWSSSIAETQMVRTERGMGRELMGTGSSLIGRREELIRSGFQEDLEEVLETHGIMTKSIDYRER